MRSQQSFKVKEGDPIDHELWNALVDLVFKGIRPTGRPPIRVTQTSVGAVVAMDDVIPKMYFGVLTENMVAPSSIGSYFETSFRRYVLTNNDGIEPTATDESIRNYDPSLTNALSGTLVIVTDAIGGFWIPLWIGCPPG